VVVMIVLSLITKARQQATRGTGKPNPKMQALIERLQAQQGGNQPVQFQGQFTRAAGPGGPPPAPTPGQPTGPVHVGTPQGSQQAAAVLQQLLQNGRQPRHAGEWSAPGQASQQPPRQFQPGQFQPAQFP